MWSHSDAFLLSSPGTPQQPDGARCGVCMVPCGGGMCGLVPCSMVVPSGGRIGGLVPCSMVVPHGGGCGVWWPAPGASWWRAGWSGALLCDDGTREESQSQSDLQTHVDVTSPVSCFMNV